MRRLGRACSDWTPRTAWWAARESTFATVRLRTEENEGQWESGPIILLIRGDLADTDRTWCATRGQELTLRLLGEVHLAEEGLEAGVGAEGVPHDPRRHEGHEAAALLESLGQPLERLVVIVQADGVRAMDAGGEYIAEGQRHVVEPCGVCLKLDFRLHPDPLTATPRFQKWL